MGEERSITVQMHRLAAVLFGGCVFLTAATESRAAVQVSAQDTSKINDTTVQQRGPAAAPEAAATIEVGGTRIVPDSAKTDSAAKAAAAPPPVRFEVYGFAMADMGYDFNQVNPDWYDTVRPTKLPSSPDQFGRDRSFYSGVRQTRFGVRSTVPTGHGDIKTTFEFDMFGVGLDAGQTTIRPRIFYGEYGHFGAGQTMSPFMDLDVFPNTFEYWGPSGMLFFRNVQVRWMPVQGQSRVTFALERPGASGDGGVYADRLEVQNVKGRFPLPDLSAEFRLGGKWGYVELAGIARYIKLDDQLTDAVDLNRDIWAGGGSFSSNIKIKKDVIRLQAVYGIGIENYFNDAPADIAVQNNPGNATSPIYGKAVPILGLVGFLDHMWSSHFTTSVGYSRVDIDNTSGQAPNAFRVGQYVAANMIFSPVANVSLGPEFLWGRRENNSDGYSVDDYRVQFSFKYNFSFEVGGRKP